ncbi:hypothetical protein [Microbacterium sp. BK668]|uniref:hypothetical protein n=1 Tax=Microbacterium sp. BK668 TaxID=2512118 RepID=UPI00105CC674|nr:hypothetical protein [Microbacterium sp. BK668]TDN91324.1 hypothetical protein EV279_0823 [Microbacterium sp. BK668]
MPSAIDPDKIPGKDIDPDAIESNASTIKTIAGSIRDNGSNVHLKWQGMAGVYEAPESGTLLGLMQPVSSQATAAGDNLDVVAGALTQFAADVRPIKAELDALRLEAQAFRDEIAGGVQVRELNPAWVSTQGYYGTTATSSGYSPYSSSSTGGSTTATSDIPQYQNVTKEWHEVQEYVDRNNDLISQVNAQQVALWEAERTCANTIRALFGGAPLHAFESEDDPLGYGLEEIPEGTEMPWGASVERSEGCGEATAKFVFKDFLWEGLLVGGVWGTIEGLGTLVLGYNPATGDWFSGDAYGAAWGNLGLLVASGVLNSPLLGPLLWADQGMEAFGGDGFLPQEVRDFKAKADEAALNTGKALIAWDKWDDDPGTALGESVFNVGTILIPGGAAVAGVKTAGTAASVLSKMARVVDLVDPAALAVNGATRLGGLGIGSLDNVIGNLGAGSKLDAPHVEVYTATDTASAIKTLDDWGVDMSSVTAHVDGLGSNVLEFPGGRIELPAGSFDNAVAGGRAGDGGVDASAPAPVREPELVSAGGVRGETGPGPVNMIVDEAPVRTETGGSGEPAVVRDPETTTGGGGIGHGGDSAGNGSGSGSSDGHPHGDGPGDVDGEPDGGHDVGDTGSSSDATGGDTTGTTGPDQSGAAPEATTPDVAWRSSENPDLTLTAGDRAAVDDFLEASRQAEPHISATLQDVVGGHPRTRLEGFDFRLKGDESLYRKIATALDDAAPGTDAARRALGDTHDAIRYTVVSDAATYADNARAVIEDLSDRGFVPVGDLKNSWGAAGYQGINSTWFDPSTGRMFEVQFHTDASFDAKSLTHHDYEEARLPGVTPDRLAELDAAMNEVFAGVEVPPGATAIDWTDLEIPTGVQPHALDSGLVDETVVGRFDNRTADDSLTFWSGPTKAGGSSMQIAESWASANGRATLEQSLAAQGLLDDMPSDWSRPETLETWRAVSSSLAEGARGEVTAVVGNVGGHSVWLNYELPRLFQNEHVTRITVISAETGEVLSSYVR